MRAALTLFTLCAGDARRPSQEFRMRPSARTSLLVLVLLICLAVPLTACTKAPDDSPQSFTTTGDFSTPFQFQIDNFVRRQNPAVYVSPLRPAGHRPKALFVPFRMMQQTAGAITVADQITRQFWQIWLSLNAFQTLQYEPEAGPYDPNRALYLARREGAELVIGGYINHFIDGASGGDSSVSLAVEIYDVKSGMLIWSLAQGGMMESRQVHDFYLFSIKERNPVDAAGFIVRTLAWDMGHEILYWVDPSRGGRFFFASPGRPSCPPGVLTPRPRARSFLWFAPTGGTTHRAQKMLAPLDPCLTP